MSDLSAVASERFAIFEAVLRHWQRRINLVSGSTLNELRRRHFFDCQQLLTLAPSWRNWLDLGSGAGFPGMVVALANEDLSKIVHLVESDKRKVAFLREVSRETGIKVEIHGGRIEALVPELCRQITFDVVSARALASLDKLVDYAEPALRAGALGLFLKGKSVAIELTAIESKINFHADIVESRTDPDGKIVILRWRQA